MEYVVSRWGDAIWAPTEDMEGHPRPRGTGWDMGAYEYGAPVYYTITLQTVPAGIPTYINGTPATTSTVEGGEVVEVS